MNAAGSALNLIAAERERQVTVKGWTPEHDDKHDGGELADAAVCYADAASAIARGASPGELHYPSDDFSLYDGQHGNLQWPWELESLDLSPDPVRNLVKAGALIVAEIERLQRAAGASG